MSGLLVLAADQQLPEDVGKAGPIGALLTVLLFIAILLLVKSMTKHLKRVPRSFDPGDDGPRVVVPDTPAELVDPTPGSGQELLDTLRRAPRAIEGPRRDDDRPGAAGG
jgi:hypothetical protein